MELAALKLPDLAFITENKVTVFGPQTTVVDIGTPSLPHSIREKQSCSMHVDYFELQQLIVTVLTVKMKMKTKSMSSGKNWLLHKKGILVF